MDAMNSTSGISMRGNNENRLYFTATDENGNLFAVINPSANLSEARIWHIWCLPADVIEASRMPNALSAIGLELVDGKFERKKDKQKELLGRNSNNGRSSKI